MPLSGPASHDGQPPAREGTYWVGALAAPAHSSSTLARIPSSPIAPSDLAPVGVRTAPAEPRRRPPRPATPAEDIGVAACKMSILPPTLAPHGPKLTLRFSLSSQAPDRVGCCAPREAGAELAAVRGARTV